MKINVKETFKGGYHDLIRPEILRLIPKPVKSVLDLGCGTGALGSALKKQRKCHVEGIEINQGAVKEAEKVLDKVHADNLNRFNPDFLDRKFDCLVFADILEHLIYPWSVLKKFTEHLNDDGIVVASIPNIAHPFIISQLQKGLFRYEPAGVLDFTHLRFFSYTTIFQLFARAGLKIFNIEPYPSKENPIQYLVQAIKPVKMSNEPLVTIIMACYNVWEMTEKAIASLYKNTSISFKLIVVDNGSTDLTTQNLRKDPTFIHLENKVNLGFAGGNNVALELVDTPYFVLANNDVLFTPDWLCELLKVMNKDKKIAIVGPRSNFCAGPSILKSAKYNGNEELEKFAKDRITYNTPMHSILPTLPFFCTLFRTGLLSVIGFLDESFITGNFEDNDYCIRTHKKGFKCAVSHRSYIHHWGSQTFKMNNINYEKTFFENKKRLFKKHCIPGDPLTKNTFDMRG